VPNADALNFIELQAFSACTTCPAGAVSPANSVHANACECVAGTYEDTQVSNPPYASRTYSSIFQGNHINSVLDVQVSKLSWSSFTADNTNDQPICFTFAGHKTWYIVEDIRVTRCDEIPALGYKYF